MNSSFFFLFDNLTWMGWNAMLAFIPFLLSYFLFSKKRKINFVWIIGFILFVLFLPNAPYIFTDIVHLFQQVPSISSDMVVLLVMLEYLLFLSLGGIIFAVSYSEFENFATKSLKYNSLVVRFLSFFFISIGVFLGRFERLNSWDLFFNPKNFLEGISSLTSPFAFLYIVVFTSILFVFYQLYLYVRRGIKKN